MKLAEIKNYLKANANPKNAAGMARFGINPNGTLGISIPLLRKLAKKIGKDHALALHVWKSGIHEAKLLAGFIDDYHQVTRKQMERWVRDFDSWDICDQTCSNLFDKTPFAYKTAKKWAKKEKKFVRRAGFVLMAALAVHDKKADDAVFENFFPIIVKYSNDERNFVKKAVNWALRQIGKRNQRLNRSAIKTAQLILRIDSPSARWIASDALRELKSPGVIKRLKQK